MVQENNIKKSAPSTIINLKLDSNQEKEQEVNIKQQEAGVNVKIPKKRGPKKKNLTPSEAVDGNLNKIAENNDIIPPMSTIIEENGERMLKVPMQGIVPAANFIFLYQTNQAGCFKHLVDSLKESMAETPFFITPQGIEISRMSPSHNKLLIQTQLFASKINQGGQFYCGRETGARIDLSLINLMRLIRSTNGSGDSITIYQKPEQEHKSVTICLQTGETGETTVTELDIINIKVNPLAIPNKDFPFVFNIYSNRLIQLARDLNSIGAQQVELCCKKDSVTFSAVGEFTKKWSRTFNVADKGIEFTACQGMVQGVFEVGALQALVKCCSLSKRVSIYAMSNFPLVAEFIIGFEGRLRCCLWRDTTQKPQQT